MENILDYFTQACPFSKQLKDTFQTLLPSDDTPLMPHKPGWTCYTSNTKLPKLTYSLDRKRK
jgi:hypothetical protein